MIKQAVNMRRRQYLKSGVAAVAAVGLGGCSTIETVQEQTTDRIGGRTPEETAEKFVEAADAKDPDAFNRLRHTEGQVPEMTADELDAEMGGHDLDVKEVQQVDYDDDDIQGVVVEVVYLIVDREWGLETTNSVEFNVRQEDGSWRVWGMATDIIINITATPNVQFNAEFHEDGTVEFIHIGGEDVTVEHLHVEIDDEVVPVESPDEVETLRTTDVVRAEHHDGEWNDESVVLVWEGYGERSILIRVDAPR